MSDKRSDFPCPAIRRDSVSRPIKSMVNGQTFDSRSDYDAHLRSTGHRIVDPGEVKSATPEPQMSAAEKRAFANAWNSK